MLRILVVDDDAPVCKALRLVLGRAGYQVREAGDGEAAVRLLRESPADLVLTDVNMPGKDGLQLALEVWALAPDLPIIVMSGQSPEAMTLLRDALPPGSILTLQKPFTTQELLGAVQRGLGGPRRASA